MVNFKNFDNKKNLPKECRHSTKRFYAIRYTLQAQSFKRSDVFTIHVNV